MEEVEVEEEVEEEEEEAEEEDLLSWRGGVAGGCMLGVWSRLIWELFIKAWVVLHVHMMM